MTRDGALFLADDPRILLGRLASYLRPYPAKKLAGWFGCSVKTAENFRAGAGWPNARHWKLIVRQFGRDVLAAVFEPEIDETLARLRREKRELEERLHEKAAHLRQALGGADGDPQRLPEAADRSLADGPPSRDLFEEARP